MTNLIVRLASFTLSLAIVTLGLSPEVFHDHEEEVHCHAQHQVGEVDACHLSIYHKAEIHKCEDHDHLTAAEQDCAICDLVMANYWLYNAFVTDKAYTKHEAKTTNLDFAAIPINRKIEQHCLRGPPVKQV